MVTVRRHDDARTAQTPEALLGHLQRRLPGFTATAAPERIRVSYRNDIYRIPAQPEPVIVKVATSQVPLDQHRLEIEARSLAALQPGGVLEDVSSPVVRPPRLLDFDASRHILMMEDVSAVRNLSSWLLEGGAQREMGQLLGRFTAALHWESFADPQLALDFDNSTIHHSRIKFQYGAVAQMCRRAGLSDAEELGRRADALGEQLRSPGVCVIQGDLWPRSVLVSADGLRVIDWELAHYGHPAQDVGHLSAHLWMEAHRAPTAEAAHRARATLRSFLTTYRAGLGSAFEEVFGPQGVRESAVHFGAEILMRTVGAAQHGYLYEGLDVEDPALQEAVQTAAQHIRSPEQVDTFAALVT